MTRATRNHWQTEPMPTHCALIPIDLHLCAAEMAVVERGLVPEVMEDKWFAFFENDTLHLHRSWTGYCFYQLHFKKEGDAFTATRLVANRDPEQYRSEDDDHDRRTAVFLIRSLLLGQPAEPPRTPGLNRQGQALAQWSLVGRAMLEPPGPSPDDGAPEPRDNREPNG